TDPAGADRHSVLAAPTPAAAWRDARLAVTARPADCDPEPDPLLGSRPYPGCVGVAGGQRVPHSAGAAYLGTGRQRTGTAHQPANGADSVRPGPGAGCASPLERRSITEQ